MATVCHGEALEPKVETVASSLVVLDHDELACRARPHPSPVHHGDAVRLVRRPPLPVRMQSLDCANQERASRTAIMTAEHEHPRRHGSPPNRRRVRDAGRVWSIRRFIDTSSVPPETPPSLLALIPWGQGLRSPWPTSSPSDAGREHLPIGSPVLHPPLLRRLDGAGPPPIGSCTCNSDLPDGIQPDDPDANGRASRGDDPRPPLLLSRGAPTRPTGLEPLARP